MSSLADNLAERLRKNCESSLVLGILQSKTKKMKCKCLHCNKNYKGEFNQTSRDTKDFDRQTGSLIKTLINSVSCSRKVFIHTNTWIAGKDSMKLQYLKRKIFEIIWRWKHYRCWLKTCTKHLEGFWSGFWSARSVPWSIRAGWYTVTSRFIWKLPKQMHRNLWTSSGSLFFSTWIG